MGKISDYQKINAFQYENTKRPSIHFNNTILVIIIIIIKTIIKIIILITIKKKIMIQIKIKIIITTTIIFKKQIIIKIITTIIMIIMIIMIIIMENLKRTAFTHTLTSTQLQPRCAKRQLSYYRRIQLMYFCTVNIIS